jgi:AcrR family transcriptional regulator
MVSAARALLAEQGVGAVTVQAVVARAGASVGSFYARFTGKENLIEHLQQEVWADVSQWWMGALAGIDWDALPLEEGIDRAVGLLQESLGVHHAERLALRVRAQGVHAEEDFQSRMRRGLSERILLRREAIGHPGPDRAVDLGIRAVHGALTDLARESASPDRSHVRSELTHLFLSYLGAWSSEEANDAPRGVDYFDVWG